MKAEIDTKCPACGAAGAFPHDAEGEDTFPCPHCAASLVAKVILENNDTSLRAWLVTQASEEAA